MRRQQHQPTKKKPLKYIEFNNVGSVRLWNYIERKKMKN
jgi:hypothetical protein